MKKPTADQCSANASIELDGKEVFACWYPQMGGYRSMCIVSIGVVDEHGDFCFDAFVWHDGEFPFGDEDFTPRMIHHCSAQQFIEFGQMILDMSKRKP